ncbi:Glycerophosphodiester phosphodiesterase 1 [Pseudolycoriella hygida]|uniref:Glycerophosphodiester phosphodiesterase 1 n=1 Tax=Pseudolycoriella hygida TaxID=35572 RepID=A0A9Q0MPJ1_9DIPT|nr:Glycerophosphodiester phosphodiesterase 1 [Pseudolycoriella hygida]
MPWLIILLIVVCIVSKFVKLKRSKYLKSFIDKFENVSDNESDYLYWPIANRGSSFDVPENSHFALKSCEKFKCKSVLLDLAMTKCGEMVLLHKTTIEKGNIYESIEKITFESLKNINISEHHPLGNQFPPEKILSLPNLLTILETMDVTVFLLLSSTTSKCIDNLKRIVQSNENFAKKIILCSSSTFVIYQMRKSCPDLVCGLWIDRTPKLENQYILRPKTIIMSLYSAFFQSILTPVIGISVVFIDKNDFNENIKNLWKNVGVHPIVYSVNSPNEKRYFQQVFKTRYLTDTLRSEPQIVIKQSKC